MHREAAVHGAGFSVWRTQPQLGPLEDVVRVKTPVNAQFPRLSKTGNACGRLLCSASMLLPFEAITLRDLPFTPLVDEFLGPLRDVD